LPGTLPHLSSPVENNKKCWVLKLLSKATESGNFWNALTEG
jgi:hypothetical protein